MADLVNLCQMLLINRGFVYETTATEHFDIVTETLQQGVVDAARHVIVVTHAAVAPYHLGEGIAEPFGEAFREGGELHYMHEIAELGCTVAEPFGAE